MSDNDDLLGDDLGDQSLADYNLGNEEEEQLLADDYDINASQNVPPSIGHNFEATQMAETDYSASSYGSQQEPYPLGETECVVPNIIVEVPVVPPLVPPSMLVEHPTYTTYEPQQYEVDNAVVPPAIPAGPMESPQIVPSEMLNIPMNNEEMLQARERFISERPANMRTPQIRDIPDSLDKVVVPGRAGMKAPRGRAASWWRNPQYSARYNQTYRRGNLARPNFPARQPFPQLEPPQIAPELPPHAQLPPNNPQYRAAPPPQPPRYFPPPRGYLPPQLRPFPAPPPRPTEPLVRMLPVQLPPVAPTGKIVLINPHFKGNFQPPVEGLNLPAYIPTRIQKSPPISPKNKFVSAGPINDIDDAAERFIAEQRSALARAASRKMPRRSPQRFIENTTIEIENDLARRHDDDLLRRQEEFINANRAGLRRRMRSPSPARRSPSPARRPPSPAPPSPGVGGQTAGGGGRRRPDPPRHGPLDEESEYRRRVREQETLRERVLRAKEVRRRKNAVVLHRQILDRQRQEKEASKLETERDRNTTNTTNTQTDYRKPELTPKSPTRERSPATPLTCEPAHDNLTPPRNNVPKPVENKAPVTKVVEKKTTVENKALVEKKASVESKPLVEKSPERNLTPPLPAPDKREDKKLDSDDDLDDLDLILEDFEGILSDDDDSGRFKEKTKKSTDVSKPKSVDLRSKLPARSPRPPRAAGDKRPKQRIVFHKDEKRAKSPPAKKSAVKSSTNVENNENIDKKPAKAKQEAENTLKMRQRIIFDKKEKEAEAEATSEEPKKPPPAPFTSRRVVLQRKLTTKPDKKDKSVFSRIEVKTDPSKPNPGIFSRAVRTAIGSDRPRIVVKKTEPEVEIATDSDIDEESLLSEDGSVAEVTNLPHGMTDTRLRTLAGNDVQNLSLDKEERSAKITFKSSGAAKTFRQKFNSKMVAASRLSVTIK